MKGILLIIIVAGIGYYFYGSNSATANENNSIIANENLTVKILLDRLPSSSVSSVEAKVAFRKSIGNLCEINGGDSENGWGTTQECLEKFETVSKDCFQDITDFDNKEYLSKKELKSDFSLYFRCTADQL